MDHRAPVISPGDRAPIGGVRRRRRAGSGPTRWAVLSAAGGCGGTTLVALLGRRLVRRGGRVCLVDADWSCPTLGALHGLDTPSDPWSGALDPQALPTFGELSVVAGRAPGRPDPSARDARRLLAQLGSRDETDVVIDLPSGCSDVALELWTRAERSLLVVTPERLPVKAAARLLARVFARSVRPLLARRSGAASADAALASSWATCGGRPASWLRALASASGVDAEQLAAAAARRPFDLVLNGVRRGDDVDVGHGLVRVAHDGLGMDLRYRGVLPWDDDGWIRARRRRPLEAAGEEDLLIGEVDDLLDRVERDEDVASRGDWRWSLAEAAAAMSGT